MVITHLGKDRQVHKVKGEGYVLKYNILIRYWSSHLQVRPYNVKINDLYQVNLASQTLSTLSHETGREWIVA